MLVFLTIAVIVLFIAIIGIIVYLWWLPIKVKNLIRENDEINEAIETPEEEDDDDDN